MHRERTRGTAASEGLSGVSPGGAEQPERLLGAGLWQEGRKGWDVGAPRLPGAGRAQVSGSPELWQRGMPGVGWKMVLQTGLELHANSALLTEARSFKPSTG